MHSLPPWRSFHFKNIPSPLRSRARTFLLTTVGILPLLFSTASYSFAGSATWLASPASGDWNTAANWTAGGPPNGASDTAAFDVSTITGVSLSANTEVGGIVFDAGASAFTITASPEVTLTISGTGITNSSGFTQNLVTAVDGAGNHGIINFLNSATPGGLTVFTNNGCEVSGMFFFGGLTTFGNGCSAGSATINNNGGTVSGARGGTTIFEPGSDAGSATLIASGGLAGGEGGLIQFNLRSMGAMARVEVFDNGALDISGVVNRVTIGSIEGTGLVFLGGNNLTVGSNNLSTTFSGMIQDGGQFGGSGGSLTKSGRGTLTLSNANSYTGGTTVSNGMLSVTNRTGSATGTGAVQVNAGTLAGTGIIDGAVTVGTGISSRAILYPSKSGAPGILTINSALSFNSLSTYKCVLKRSSVKTSKATALGVTITTGASFSFVDMGTGTLTVGTVFTLINNTSANPILGTFSNLPDGSIFTSNGNNFQASYEGGDGNDLTLTVVP